MMFQPEDYFWETIYRNLSKQRHDRQTVLILTKGLQSKFQMFVAKSKFPWTQLEKSCICI